MNTNEDFLHAPPVDTAAWSAALATFVIGDAVTTAFGLTLIGVVESHPVSASVLSVAGFGGMVAAKVAVTAVAFAFFRHADRRYRGAIPIALAEVGAAIVGVNVAVIAFVLL
jgi:hypothetical protein